MVQPIGVRDETDGKAVEELDEVFARLAPEIARERPALRDLATIRAGVEARRENVSEVWAWLAHPSVAVAEVAKLFGPATLTAIPRVTQQTAEELWAMFETTAMYHRLTPEVRVALRAEDQRIIRRAGGTLRSTQLVVRVWPTRKSRESTEPDHTLENYGAPNYGVSDVSAYNGSSHITMEAQTAPVDPAFSKRSVP